MTISAPRTCSVCGQAVLSEPSYKAGVSLLYEPADPDRRHYCDTSDVSARLRAAAERYTEAEFEEYITGAVEMNGPQQPPLTQLGGVRLD